jgi:hypothetical protein
MQTKINQFGDRSMEIINSMENRLAGILKPIKPSKEFVHGVAARLQIGNRAALVERMTNWHVISMVIAGLISLAVFMAVVGGVVMSLLRKNRTA